MRLAIFAAFPQELRKIIKNLKAAKDARGSHFDIYRATHLSTEIVLVITGIGTANAELALRHIHAEFGPDIIMSIGYGGALNEGAAIGDLIWGSKFILMPELIEAETSKLSKSEHLEISGNEKIHSKLLHTIAIRAGDIVTIRSPMKKSELKKTISEELLNPVCDMETFPLAHFCLETGLRFVAVRSITDLQGEDIPPELYGISNSSGKYSLACALRMLIFKPRLLPSVFRLARNSQKASHNLCSLVHSFLETLQ
ncbi:MAG: hypothetical protein ACLP29_16755 [Dissulfurispiraceae bacterium]